MKQMVDAVEYMHSVAHICHRDLNANNIIVENWHKNPKVKIIDFNVAKHFMNGSEDPDSEIS